MKLIPWSRESRLPSTTWPETTSLFEKVLEDFFDDRPLFSSLLENRFGREVPAINILEKDGAYILTAELPGMEEKDFQLNIEGNRLTLKGERKLEHEDNQKDYRRIESFHGSFTRSLRLPDTVDLEKVKAEYRNGILKVTIPQKPELRARSIPVTVN